MAIDFKPLPKENKFGFVPAQKSPTPVQAKPDPMQQGSGILKTASNISEGFLNTAIGAFKGLPSSIVSASSIPMKAGSFIGDAASKLAQNIPGFKQVGSTIAGVTGVTPQTAKQLGNIKPLPSYLTQAPTGKAGFGEGLLTGKNTAQKVGMFGEQLAEFAVPGIGEEKAGVIGSKVASKIPGLAEKAPWIAKKVAPFLSKSLFSGIDNAARTFLQSAGNLKQTKEAGVIGSFVPGVSSAFHFVGGLGSAVIKQISSTLSNVPKGAIEQAFKDPVAVQLAMKKFSESGSPEKILQDSESSFSAIKKSQSDAYKAGLKKVQDETMQFKNGQWYVKTAHTQADVASGLIKQDKVGTMYWNPTTLTTGGIKNVTTSVLRFFGLDATKQEVSLGKAAIDKPQLSKLQELVDRIYSWKPKDVSPTGLNDLRKVIDGYKISSLSLSSSEKQYNKIIGEMRTNLSKYVGERVPQIAKMNGEYHAAQETMDKIIEYTRAGSQTVSDQTKINKLLGVFNPKSEIYKPIVEQLGEEGGKNLMSDIAGYLMSKATPEGKGAVITTLFEGAGLSHFLTNPIPTAAAMVGTAIAGSPRAVGEIVATAGKVAQSPITKGITKTIPTTARGVIGQEVRQNP